MNEWAPDVPQAVRSELPPYGIKPHWVTFGFSSPANRLYDLYNAHVDRGRGDLVVWPTLDELAKMMGLSRGDKVTPYMRELETGGAIGVETVTKTGGKGRRYIVTLKVHPPAGFTGPLQTSDWYAANRTDKPGKTTMADRARGVHSEELAGDEVPPLKGVYLPPAGGGDVHPPEGAVSSNHSNHNQNKKNGAPSARSAGDARRASAGSSACDARGGSAATGKTSSSTKAQLTREQAAAVALIEDSLPEGLVEELRGKRLMGRHLPVSVRLAIVTALDGRTPEQLVDRVARRWVRHGYAKKLRDGGRIASPLGVVHALVRAGECPDLGCEDGLMLDTGVDCRACEGRKDSHRRGERKTTSMPKQRQAAPSWTCTGCYADSFTTPPEALQCATCAAKTQAAFHELTARLQADALLVDAPDACQADGAPWSDEEPPDPDEAGEEPYDDEQAAYTGTFDDLAEEANR